MPALLSIIVTTYNWPAALEAVLQALSQQQTTQPFEVLVADDGSSETTAELIQSFYTKFPVPLKHIWQPDQGFRAAKIRNQAILAAQGEYIVFLDGDCIPRLNFVQEHARLAESGFFVVGHRVLLNSAFTQHILASHLAIQKWSLTQWFWAWVSGKVNRFLSFLPLPLGPLRKLRQTQWQGAKGCNLGIWKRDLEQVNGWEEQFSGWGYEDSDLVIRLLQTHVQRKEGRFALPVIHLWHPENDRQRERQNWALLKTRQSSKQIRSQQGLSQYEHSNLKL